MYNIAAIPEATQYDRLREQYLAIQLLETAVKRLLQTFPLLDADGIDTMARLALIEWRLMDKARTLLADQMDADALARYTNVTAAWHKLWSYGTRWNPPKRAEGTGMTLSMTAEGHQQRLMIERQLASHHEATIDELLNDAASLIFALRDNGE